MSDYVVDENIVYDAWRGKTKENKKAIKERRFIYTFLDTHYKLAANPKILSKYYGMSKKIMEDKEFTDPAVLGWFLERLLDSNKTKIVDGVKTNFIHLKNCDREFVGVALHVDGFLVTKDGRMKDEIEIEGLSSRCKYTDIESAIQTIT